MPSENTAPSFEVDDPPLVNDLPVKEFLTREEDDELRRLYFMSQIGELSQRSRERMIELRLRDRRGTIRSPREFGEDS